MPLQRQTQIAPRDAEAVVGNPDQGLAAIRDGNPDPACPGIDGVLHQFLHGGRRAFDHFARRDAVGGRLRQAPDSRRFTHHVAVVAVHATKHSMAMCDSGSDQ
jgi:hypothetical protein